MKVAFFIGSLNRGGAETLVLDTFRMHGVLPFECILFYRNEGDLSDDFRATGVPMFRIKPQGFKLVYFHQLRRILKRERVDILHAQTLLNAFLSLFCVCFSSVKLVASFHGFYSSIRDRFFTHFVMWFADASLFVSSYEREWYLRQTLVSSQRKFYVVPNGIDFSKLTRQYPCPSFLERTELSSSGQKINLAMVGSFVEGRSQLFLCKCIKRLLDDGCVDFQFYFIGRRSAAEPERFDECLRFCEENGLLDVVHFLGARSDVPAILQHIDGFVYATNHDSFGIAVVEAMAAGLPVVVNDWEVMKEISCDGKYACLYKTRDIDDCVERLKGLLMDLPQYKYKARLNASFVREKYSIENHIQNLYSLYQRVVS